MAPVSAGGEGSGTGDSQGTVGGGGGRAGWDMAAGGGGTAGFVLLRMSAVTLITPARDGICLGDACGDFGRGGLDGGGGLAGTPGAPGGRIGTSGMPRQL